MSVHAGEVSPADIRAQLERMLACPLFQKSPRLSRFLQFTVEQTLKGEEKQLKEYNIGVAVFGRPESFDPRLDSIVRVEARRLRSKVQQYYATAGQRDVLRISFQPGSYTPDFLDASAPMPAESMVQRVAVLTGDPARAESLLRDVVDAGFTPVSGDPLAADVVLLDPAMAEQANLPLGKPECPAIVGVVSALDEESVQSLIRSSATGYLLLPARDGELRAAIELAGQARGRADAPARRKMYIAVEQNA